MTAAIPFALLLVLAAPAVALPQAVSREPQAEGSQPHTEVSGPEAGSRKPEAQKPPLIGGRVYRAKVEAGGAQVAVWRYAAAGHRVGPPVLLFPELGLDRRIFDLRGFGLARALQDHGHEVFVVEWRNTGASSGSLPGMGGLDALFDGDARAALKVAREASPDGRVQLVGYGLGGAAAYLLAADPDAKIAAVVALAVPARYEVPNEAVRAFVRAAKAKGGLPAGNLDLRTWSRLPAPVGDGLRDLFGLLFLYGDSFTHEQGEALRALFGKAAPELIGDVWRWMEAGDLPRAGSLKTALKKLTAPLLVAVGLRDNLVHLEHALAVRELAPNAKRQELILQRVEGYPEDAGHLVLQAPWAAHDLFPKIEAFLREHQ